ncbi:TetR/AcrR family transcriptional regulator [Actinoplanes sp. RD1]|uniref:TetR/AcrR family transcriptional regulator n=1 Tax=Actinoplanes sp. RD1 TaxID=3064538 RepID=UPI002741FD69|nr:TetR/AcrR family transcriptional regulator [Actinoplanes sp. RD1]
MPRTNADTREQARAVAEELFTTQGFERTSLSEIAGRLGISKAALYYHFKSKTDLLRSLVEPMATDLEQFLTTMPAEPRALLEAYFDLCCKHRRLLLGLLRDVGALNALEFYDAAVNWRTRIDAVLTGINPADRVRAVVALGGLQDTVILFADEPELTTTLREQAVAAALRALTPA